MSPVWQSWGKVELLFMTFKMAWGRQVGLCIKFIWNLHFDWPTVWANSTVTYRSDRDIWQLPTIAEMAFKTQLAGESWGDFPSEQPHSSCNGSPASPTGLGVAFNKDNGDIFPKLQNGNPPGVSLHCLSFRWPPLCFLSPLITRAGSFPLKSTVSSGPACVRLMQTITVCLQVTSWASF